MQNKESKFNWKLPLYGAVGFSAGGSICGAFENAVRGDILPAALGVIGFAILGAIGGAVLGLALKDKKNALYLSCAGAAGFAAGGVIKFTAWFFIILGIGIVIGLASGFNTKSTLVGIIVNAALGGVFGLLIGGMGGAALGLALKDKKSALFLSCAGAVGFALGGAIGFAVGYASQNMSYIITHTVMGAIGGAALGLTLAYLTKNEEK
ncbi:MAG: hypothetical protein A7315_10645 [Candidatus Altiarchaeales archaeon WOR_SM1_79]|nr:MAG: hypothetical protein A7315_10645 [Candidatus Altiarchaeales archaeon WOR_SM1_79]